MPISPLRQRMIGDMTSRHIGEKTQKNHVRCVRSLTPRIKADSIDSHIRAERNPP
jgi:hypothetical protein